MSNDTTSVQMMVMPSENSSTSTLLIVVGVLAGLLGLLLLMITIGGYCWYRNVYKKKDRTSEKQGVQHQTKRSHEAATSHRGRPIEGGALPAHLPVLVTNEASSQSLPFASDSITPLAFQPAYPAFAEDMGEALMRDGGHVASLIPDKPHRLSHVTSAREQGPSGVHNPLFTMPAGVMRQPSYSQLVMVNQQLQVQLFQQQQEARSSNPGRSTASGVMTAVGGVDRATPQHSYMAVLPHQQSESALVRGLSADQHKASMYGSEGMDLQAWQHGKQAAGDGKTAGNRSRSSHHAAVSVMSGAHGAGHHVGHVAPDPCSAVMDVTTYGTDHAEETAAELGCTIPVYDPATADVATRQASQRRHEMAPAGRAGGNQFVNVHGPHITQSPRSIAIGGMHTTSAAAAAMAARYSAPGGSASYTQQQQQYQHQHHQGGYAQPGHDSLHQHTGVGGIHIDSGGQQQAQQTTLQDQQQSGSGHQQHTTAAAGGSSSSSSTQAGQQQQQSQPASHSKVLSNGPASPAAAAGGKRSAASTSGSSGQSQSQSQSQSRVTGVGAAVRSLGTSDRTVLDVSRSKQQQQQQDVQDAAQASAKQAGSSTARQQDSSTGLKEEWDPHREVAALARELQRQGTSTAQLQLTELIGQGAHGSVFKGVWRNLEVAVKQVMFSDRTGSGSGVLGGNKNGPKKRAIMEAAVCTSMVHPNVVCTYHYEIATIKDDKPMSAQGVSGGGMTVEKASAIRDYKLYLVQEYCDASLHAVLGASILHDPASHTPNMDLVLSVLLDIARGLQYIQSKGIIHGDLKPENVLLKNDAQSPIGVIAKITDFGLSASLRPGDTHLSNIANGTPFYNAPEVVSAGKVTKASDVYSFGMLLWETYRCMPPWIRTKSGYCANARFRRYPPDVPPPLLDLTLQCLHEHPKSRPTFEEIVTALSAMHAAFLSGHQDLRASSAATSWPNPKLLDKLGFTSDRDPVTSWSRGWRHGMASIAGDLPPLSDELPPAWALRSGSSALADSPPRGRPQQQGAHDNGDNGHARDLHRDLQHQSMDASSARYHDHHQHPHGAQQVAQLAAVSSHDTNNSGSYQSSSSSRAGSTTAAQQQHQQPASRHQPQPHHTHHQTVHQTGGMTADHLAVPISPSASPWGSVATSSVHGGSGALSGARSAGAVGGASMPTSSTGSSNTAVAAALHVTPTAGDAGGVGGCSSCPSPPLTTRYAYDPDECDDCDRGGPGHSISTPGAGDYIAAGGARYGGGSGGGYAATYPQPSNCSNAGAGDGGRTPDTPVFASVQRHSQQQRHHQHGVPGSSSSGEGSTGTVAAPVHPQHKYQYAQQQQQQQQTQLDAAGAVHGSKSKMQAAASVMSYSAAQVTGKGAVTAAAAAGSNKAQHHMKVWTNTMFQQ